MTPTTQRSSDADAGVRGATDPHAERFAHYEAAARLSVEAHPLPGEDLRTPHLEDAQMWHRVYSELLAFKETLIRDTQRALEALSTPGREEVRNTDALVLEAEANRFRQRLSQWKTRCQELADEA